MQPNILVFFTDQQRWDTVGCYNPAVSTTPVLDQLAREGVKFEKPLLSSPCAARHVPACKPGATRRRTAVIAIMSPCDRMR
ncbi:arylsulfatase [Klebsiella variicola]|nr:arylsulfatase [Klebsiella variicola]